MIYLFILLQWAIYSFPLDVYFRQQGHDKINMVYENGEFNKQFNSAVLPPLASCTPDPFIFVSQKSDDTTIILELSNDQQYTVNIQEISSRVLNKQSVITSTVDGNYGDLQPLKSIEFLIQNKCQVGVEYTNDNVWSVILLSITVADSDPLVIEYQFNCDEKFRFYNFDWSLFCLVAVSSILVTTFAKFGVIYSFKVVIKSTGYKQYFQGFTINIMYPLGYCILMILYGLASIFYEKYLIIPSLILLGILGIMGCAFFIDELIYFIPHKYKLQQHICRKIRICDIIALSSALILLLLYYILGRPWYMNDLIGFCMIGTFVKLFKLTSLKLACILLSFCIIIDIVAGLIVHYSQDESYNQLVQLYFNYPVELQVPMFITVYQKKCSWISIFSIIVPGLLLGYLQRYDRSKNNQTYNIIGLISLLIGQVIWILVDSINVHAWPQSAFTFPFMLIPVLIWSYKQKDLQVLWSGYFYDQQYYNPFQLMRSTKNSVNDVIRTNSVDGMVQLNRNLFDDLDKVQPIDM